MTAKIQQLRKWIESLHDEPVSVDGNTDLVESRLVSSLQFIQMVMEIERINDAKLEPGVIKIEKMRTLNSIDESIFKQQPQTAQ